MLEWLPAGPMYRVPFSQPLQMQQNFPNAHVHVTLHDPCSTVRQAPSALQPRLGAAHFGHAHSAWRLPQVKVNHAKTILRSIGKGRLGMGTGLGMDSALMAGGARASLLISPGYLAACAALLGVSTPRVATVAAQNSTIQVHIACKHSS